MPVADLTRRIRYFVTNLTTNTVSVIDGFTNNVIRTYTVGAGPRDAVAAADGNVYVASGGNDTITTICIEGNTKVLNIPNDGYLAVDTIMGRIYVTDGSALKVYDLATGSFIVSINGPVTPETLTLNNNRNKLFIADGSTVKVYSTITLDHINTITLPGKANHIVISPDDKRAYISYGVSTGVAGVQVYNLVNDSMVTNITSGALTEPTGMALKNNILYVVNNTALGAVVPVDIVSYTPLPGVIPVGANPLRISLSPDTTRLYVTNSASGTVSIINLSTNTVESVFLGIANQPINVVGNYVGSLLSPGDPIDFSDPYQLDDIKESVCIIAKKVFAHAQDRICFSLVNIPIPVGAGSVTLEKMIFDNGSIVPGTLVITPLPERPNFSRAQFTITVPYRGILRAATGETVTVTGVLPNIDKDIVLFRPQTRDEFVLDIIIETRSEILNTPTVTQEVVRAAIGVFTVIKVVGEVQLLIPAFGYCPEPPECEEYEEPEDEDVCKIFLDFTQTPFPEDFFPPMYEDVQCRQ